MCCAHGVAQAAATTGRPNEHGIYVDPKGGVWIGGNAATDHMLLKFTTEGKFVMQIGKPGKSEGSNSTTQLGRLWQAPGTRQV